MKINLKKTILLLIKCCILYSCTQKVNEPQKTDLENQNLKGNIKEIIIKSYEIIKDKNPSYNAYKNNTSVDANQEIYKFNEKGMFKEYFSSNTGFTVKKNYIYNNDGLIIKLISESIYYSNPSWNENKIHEFKYDKKNNLLEEKIIINNDIKRIIKFEYIDNLLVKKTLNDKFGKVEAFQNYLNGNLILDVEYENGKIVNKDSIIYNSQNQKIEMLDLIYKSKVFYRYDSFGNLINSENFDSNNKIKLKINYSYDDSHNLLNKTETTFNYSNNSHDRTVDSYEYQYDENNLLIKETKKSGFYNGEVLVFIRWQSYSDFNYKIDKFNNWVIRDEIIDNGNYIKRKERNIKYYENSK